MTPKTRKETYLAKAAGDDVSIPEPITREEKYLSRIAQGGGGGGTAGLIVTLTASNDGYTGDKTVAEIKSVIDGGGCVYLFYPDGDMRIIAEYTDDTSLRIGVFSEDEYTVYSVVDDGSNGITLTVVSETNTNPYYDYTPTAAEQQAIMAALQAYITAGVQNTGSPVHTQYSADFSALAGAAKEAYLKGQIFRINMSLGGSTGYVMISPTSGIASDNNGTTSGMVPYSAGISGIGDVFTLIQILTFSDKIHLSGTVFVS